MNYELVKKLKEAGFQTKYVFIKDVLKQATKEDISNMKIGHIIKKGTSVEYRFPTLSEIIEKCGDNFISLNRIEDTGYFHAKGQLELLASPVFYTEGSTPEEAVANLWLELNKK